MLLFTHKQFNLLKIVGIIIFQILLMMIRNILLITINNNTLLSNIFVFIGNPIISLLLDLVASIWLLGIRIGINYNDIYKIFNYLILNIDNIIIIIVTSIVFFSSIITYNDIFINLLEILNNTGLAILTISFLLSSTLRIVQGTTINAFISAVSIISEEIINLNLTSNELILMFLSIFSGIITFLHINDPEFYMIKNFKNLSILERLKNNIFKNIKSLIVFSFIFIIW